MYNINCKQNFIDGRRYTKAIYDKYKNLDPKKQDAFYDKHSEKIQDYEAARDYLKGVMGANKALPIKAWQSEQKKLTDAKFTLCERYYELQDELRSVELLRKSTENIMREEKQERQPTRAQNVDL